jgi:hypothetical protein
MTNAASANGHFGAAKIPVTGIGTLTSIANGNTSPYQAIPRDNLPEQVQPVTTVDKSLAVKSRPIWILCLGAGTILRGFFDDDEAVMVGQALLDSRLSEAITIP